MLRSACLSLILLVSPFALVAVPQEIRPIKMRPITEAETVFAIYTNNWGHGASGSPELIVCIWGDGSIVWSNDPVHGGAPYYTAQLKPESVSNAFKKIANVGAFDIPRLKNARYGPDSRFTTILVRAGGKELKMNSWHELYEANGKVVAADHGLTGLDGRKLLQVLAEQPADYLHYRMTWLELRLAAANLIPRSDSKSTGTATMLRGNLSWNPQMKTNRDGTKR